MTRARLTTLTVLALLAFAGNSLRCRLALRDTAIDAATFTTLRLVSGALTLRLIVHMRRKTRAGGGSWPSTAMTTPVPTDVREQMDELWFAVAGKALTKNESTLAFVPMSDLLGEYGYLEWLRERGRPETLS